LSQDDSCDPLIWWNFYQKTFPILSAMTKDYLAIQATLVSCEQAFSIAGLTIPKVQNQLSPEITYVLLSVTGNVTKKEGKIFSLRLIKKNL